MKTFLRKLRWLLQRPDREAQLREELEFHLSEEMDEREAEGAPKDQARWAAHRELGNLTLVQENTRAAWGWTFLEQVLQDLRYALRTMLRNRAFSILALTSLALGIGANTVIYSFMDSILFRSLPVSHPQSLVLLNWHSKEPRGPRPNHVMHGSDGSTWNDRDGTSSGIFPFGAFELLRENASVLSTLFAFYPTEKRTLAANRQAELAVGEYVSGDYFRGLDVVPAAGRLILSDDDRAGAPLVTAISMRVSEHLFGGAANAVGQSVMIDNVPFTVIGVTPAEFFGVDPETHPDFYVPLHSNLVLDGSQPWAKTPKSYLDRNYYWIEMMGRLRPGVNLAQAQAVLAPQFHQWVAGTATNPRESDSLPTLSAKEGAGGLETLRRRYSKPLFVLWAMVGLILAIACANIANLLLSRAASRQREMAVRLSIGAGRLRLVRQLLTESLLLAFIGGGAGVVLAIWGVDLLTRLLANGTDTVTPGAQLNWHVLLATLALSMLCGSLFGLAPAIRSTTNITPALKGSAAAEPRARLRLAFWRVGATQGLVIAQIVFSLLMLVAAGLFMRTLSNLQSIQLGFSRENLLLFDVNARQAGHREPEILTFYAELQKKFAAIPGVRDATLSHASLLKAGRRLELRVSGVPVLDTWILNTGPRFFSTMQIPILVGREIDERDQPSSPPAVVVNERFAKLRFGSDNPLGRHITLGGPHPRDMEIVGVCANAHYGNIKDDVRPVVFIPYDQGDYPRVQGMVYTLRSSGTPLTNANAVRQIVRAVDSRVPVTNLRTQAAEIDYTMNQEIVFARLCTGFAMLALVIASVGLYGTMMYTVSRRTREIGIRMALGAHRGAVIGMILRHSLLLAAMALAIGLPAALAASKLVESFLFGIKPNDALALTCAVGVLVLATLVAGYMPAWKASRIDPLSAIRYE